MRLPVLFEFFVFACVAVHAWAAPLRSSFQNSAAYDARYDIRTDGAIVYGVNDTLTSRIASWRAHGYVPQLMTGAAWGEYEAYFGGDFDGKSHRDEGQADSKGHTIWHHPGVPYVVPTPSYVDYLTSLAKQAVNAGAQGLYLEEPEFWSRAGYSTGFQKLWQAEYRQPWQRPDSSPDAFWRSSKLKYALYRRALGTVFSRAKVYAAQHSCSLPCFVPTHSLINYSQWGIVSPETSLMDLPDCDGYIAQVWTGTARQRNRFRGVERERTFQTAYLEYASMAAMTAPTGRTVYFLADPVEDDPTHTWDDYQQNYERVIAASLLFPAVSNFETMPWPSRVFLNEYPAGSYGKPGEKTTIPPAYAAELMIVVNALSEMNQSHCTWSCGSSDIGVLVSDTMMFQRGSPWCSDSCFDEFYGLALPLLHAGIPARAVVLEQIMKHGAMEGISALVMSYDHMKPLRPEYNQLLAQWVREGGALILCGGDSDRFNQAKEWWNASAASAGSPRRDLLQRLGVPSDKAGLFHTGKGYAVVAREKAAAFAQQTTGPEVLLGMLREVLARNRKQLRTSNSIALKRGPYLVGAVLDESISTEPLHIRGTYVDLFTSNATTVENPVKTPGEVFLLREVPAHTASHPAVLASSWRVDKVLHLVSQLSLHVSGPLGSPGIIRLSLPHPPRRVSINSGTAQLENSTTGGTCLVRFQSSRTTATLQLEL